MAENKGLGMIMIVFILIIVGIAFTQIIADQNSDLDTTRVAVNNTITFTGGWALLGNANLRTLGNIITTGTVASNTTNNTIGTSNYIITSNGSLQLKGGVGAGTSTGFKLTFSYLSENYVADTTSKTVMGLVVLFLILGIFLYVLAATGILDLESIIGGFGKS